MTTSSTTSASNDKDHWISELVDAGFALIPLMPGTKHPFGTEWPNTVPDPTAIPSRFPDNYGVVLRDDLLVIDVDPKNFPPGDDPWVRLKADLGLEPHEEFDTYTVRSRSYNRGQESKHVYFTKPPGINLQPHLKKYSKAVEVFSYGMMVVGPGSIHPETKKPYVVASGDPAKLMPAPQKLLDMYARVEMTHNTGMAGFTDDAFTKRRFTDYVLTCEPSVKGAGSDKHTVDVAKVGYDFNLSEAATLEIMIEHFNPRCSPPWPIEGNHDKNLTVKVANAYKYAKDAPGNRHVSAAFDKAEPPKNEEAEKYQKQKEAKHRAEKRAGIQWDRKWLKGEERWEYSNTLDNILNFFRTPEELPEFENDFYQLVRYNVFSQRIEFNRRAPWQRQGQSANHWTDADNVMLRAWFSNNLRWNPPITDIQQGVLTFAKTRAYHPVVDYYKSLKWDGVSRISMLLAKYADAEDNRYTEAVSRCLMISLIARIMTPGCKQDHIVILEGVQGAGKSTFCDILGGDWALSGHLDPHNKDTVLRMLGKLVVELPEMAYNRKSDADSLKAFISTRVDTIRLPYGRIAEDIPRQSVFIATTNEEHSYLPDLTGNRRFWPVKVGEFDLEALRRDRDQLFAEAYYCWAAGEAHYLDDPEVIKMATQEQEKRAENESWADYVSLWLQREHIEGRRHLNLTTTEIASQVLNLAAHQINRGVTIRVASAMRSLGWPDTRIIRDSKRMRGYTNPNPFNDGLDEILKGI